MAVRVTIQAAPHVAPMLHGLAPPSADSEEIVSIARAFGGTLEPLHPDTDDPSLQRYFTVDVADEAVASQVLARVRQSSSIAAAYVKPPDEAP